MPDGKRAAKMEEKSATTELERAASVSVKLGPAIHGWIQVKLHLGSYELECPASFVLNNPVDELMDAHALVASGGNGVQRICLWLEPAGYAIDVENAADGNCRLTVSYDGSFVPPMTGHSMKLVHSCMVPTVDLRSALHGALSAFIASAPDPSRPDDVERLREKWRQRVAGGRG